MNKVYTITIYNKKHNMHTMYYEFNNPSCIRINNNYYPFTFHTKRGYHYERVELSGFVYEISYVIANKKKNKKINLS